MTGSTKIYPVSRLYSSAADLTNGDLKTIKQRLETVGIEPSRLLAEWMKKSLGLELDIPPEKGDSVSVEGAEKRRQIERSRIIADVLERVRTELGPIAGVDPVNAEEK